MRIISSNGTDYNEKMLLSYIKHINNFSNSYNYNVNKIIKII